MPIYNYRCRECGYLFERLILNTDSDEVRGTECPECGGESPRSYEGHALHYSRIDKEFAEDEEEYREMHYYEKQGDWERAARAAEGVSEFARNKFLQKARTERN